MASKNCCQINTPVKILSRQKFSSRRFIVPVVLYSIVFNLPKVTISYQNCFRKLSKVQIAKYTNTKRIDQFSKNISQIMAFLRALDGANKRLFLDRDCLISHARKHCQSIGNAILMTITSLSNLLTIDFGQDTRDARSEEKIFRILSVLRANNELRGATIV